MEEPTPLISIIVPIYNIEGYLPTCLNNIAALTFKNIEVIPVDDGAIDKSREIFDEFCKDETRFVVVNKKSLCF